MLDAKVVRQPARQAWLRQVVIAAIAAYGLIGSAIATAAPPNNDDCTGFVEIPGDGPFPYQPPPVDITDATPQGSPDPISGGCTPMDRTIWYRFTPSVTGKYEFNSCYCALGGASELDVADNVIIVLGAGPSGCPSGGTLVGCDDNACPCNCTGSNCGIPGAPFTNQAAVDIPLVGGETYYIVVGNHLGNFVPDHGQIRFQVSMAPPNETCTAPTQLPLDRITYGTTVSAENDYRSTNPGGVGANTACFTGVGQTPVTAGGRDVVFRFEPPDTDTYSFRYVQDRNNAALAVGANPVLYLADTCPPSDPNGASPPHCIAAANRQTNQSNFMFDGNNNRGEEIQCVLLTGGTPYYLFFDDETINGSWGDFAVEVTRCRKETEPNNSTAAATPFGPNLGCFMEGSSIASGANVCSGNANFGCVPIAGTSQPAYNAGCLVCSGSATTRCLTNADCSSLGFGTCTANVGTCSVADGGRDVDFYLLGAPPLGSKVFVGVDAAASNASDYELRITSATATLGYDDNDGTANVGTNAPIIAGVIAPGGNIYARLNSVPHSAGNEPYRLFARLETGSPQPEPATDTTPDLSVDFGLAYPVTGGGFVNGAMQTATDTDCWKFLAHEGDNIVMFADNNPTRAAGNVAGNVWPVLGTLDNHPPSNTLFSGQILRNNVTASPGTLTAFRPTVTSEFLQYRARYTGAHLVCFAEARGADNALPTGAHPLAYQGSISINCGLTPAWGAETAEVSVTQTGPPGPVRTGDVFDYTITVTNNHMTGVAEDVRLSDTFPAGLAYVTGGIDDGYNGGATSCQSMPTPGANDAPIDCTTFSLAPGASVTYTLTVQVADCFGSGSNIVNVASITTASADSNSSNNSASFTVITSDCNDGNPCTDDACTNSACVHTSNTNACNDGNSCTTNDTCVSGSCVGGAPPTCTDGNPCTTDSCNPASGCVFPAATGHACNDNNVCTTEDTCNAAGQCAGGPPLDCDDGNACTTDACALGDGCHNLPIDCFDDDSCTIDSCDPANGCQNTAIDCNENTSAPAGAGGTVSTDSEADGATPADPVESTITTPNGGTVTIEESQATIPPPQGLSLLGLQIDVTAPQATAADPVRLVFRIDASVLPPGFDVNTLVIYKDGIAVAECTGSPGVASPDPCTASHVILPDGDLEVTVLASFEVTLRTSSSSTFNFGFPECQVPAEATGVTLAANKDTLTWTATGGAGISYDAVRGVIAQLPVGSGPLEACLAIELAGPTVTDPVRPSAGAGYWYLVRARNACGVGGYGFRSNGAPRVVTECP